MRRGIVTLPVDVPQDVEVVKDPDLTSYTCTEKDDTGDGLRISIYEKEGEATVLSLEWEEGTKWDYLNEGNFEEAFETMLADLLGEEEAAELMDGMVVIPEEEWQQVKEEAGEGEVAMACGLRPASSVDGDSDPTE